MTNERTSAETNVYPRRVIELSPDLTDRVVRDGVVADDLFFVGRMGITTGDTANLYSRRRDVTETIADDLVVLTTDTEVESDRTGW